MLEVRIGVIYSPKELSVELEGVKSDEIVGTIEAALKDGSPVIWLADKKGRRIGVPADKVAYIEVAEEDQAKRVGFGPS